MTKPNLFSYDDFRVYITDWLVWRRLAGAYSIRAFARDAGFSSPNILQHVLQGEKRLAGIGVFKFSAALELNEREAEYFENLVFFNQAIGPTERLRFYKRLISHPKRQRMVPLESAQLTFFREWLSPVIYEMVDFPDFHPDHEWIAAQFAEPPRLLDIRKAMADLLAVGLVEELKDGSWRKKEGPVTSGDNIKDLHLFAYHEAALEKTADALIKLPMTERSFNVITTSVPKSAYEEIRKKFEALEGELVALIESSKDPRDEVMQIGWYLFPAVRRRKGKSK